MLEGKRIIVGVCGGIAAYKTVDIVSRLKKLGADVYVLMTRSACEFITPLTFQTVSKNAVFTGNAQMPAGGVYDSPDAIIVAPATAKMLGKLSERVFDDAITRTVSSANCRVFLVPALTAERFAGEKVQHDITELKDRGFEFIDPESGYVENGKGKMAGVEAVSERVCSFLAYEKDFEGKRILITAGPTREFIDPLRFVSNYSTGKIGYSLAREAHYRGADVTLVSGPTHIRHVSGVKLVEVNSAVDMYNAVMSLYENQDIIIKSAAISDFRPSETASGDDVKDIRFTRNPDILSELGKKVTTQVLVGFCSERGDIVTGARQKLVEKNIDMIVANDLYNDRALPTAFSGGATIVEKNGNVVTVDAENKEKIAHVILDEVKKIKK